MAETLAMERISRTLSIGGMAILLVSSLMFVPSAAAQAPAAVVEDVKGDGVGVGFMDYLSPGQIIRLGPVNSIVLGYLKSCWQETIIGGTVTVGTEQSDIEGGKVERTKTQCDAGRIQLTPQQANQSAGMVFRAKPLRAAGPAGTPEPQFTLHGLSPLIEAKGGGTLVIERLDQSGERYMLPLGSGQLLRNSFYDFASSGRALSPGGIYRASLGTRQIVFRVDPGAKPGQAPVLGRLLRFQPAN
jgi:hypothetical protein